jgi:uncharacterized metal-binding protein YceD (DUF177 family)
MDLKFNIEQLKDGKIEKFHHTVAPSILELYDEKELTFSEIELQGQLYLAADHLIVQASIKTQINMPCSICNEMTSYPLSCKEITHAETISDIKAGIFDLGPIVREELLLQLPQFIECKGKCPERETLKKYLKTPAASPKGTSYHPFADL